MCLCYIENKTFCGKEFADSAACESCSLRPQACTNGESCSMVYYGMKKLHWVFSRVLGFFNIFRDCTRMEIVSMSV